MCCVCLLQREYGGDACDIASNLCKHELRKGVLFVPIWARVLRVTRKVFFSEIKLFSGLQ